MDLGGFSAEELQEMITDAREDRRHLGRAASAGDKAARDQWYALGDELAELRAEIERRVQVTQLRPGGIAPLRAAVSAPTERKELMSVDHSGELPVPRLPRVRFLAPVVDQREFRRVHPLPDPAPEDTEPGLVYVPDTEPTPGLVYVPDTEPEPAAVVAEPAPAVKSKTARSRWTRRPPRALIAAVPVLAVNACAFLGQLGYLRAHLLTWGLPGQLLVAFALESMAVYLSYHAHVSRLADDSVFRVQFAAYALAIVIAAMNYSHWAGPHWHATPIAVTFGLMSAASPWLWGVHSRRESRDALKARGLIESHAVRLGANRWFWYPVRSVRVTRLAAWEGITNPGEAIALDRAAELPATEMEPAHLAAMAPRERLTWAWGVIGSTDVPKACTLLASLGAPIDASHARAIRRKLAELSAKPAALEEGGQS